jgi:EmrB/QacA subfamily drug resistance transporter
MADARLSNDGGSASGGGAPSKWVVLAVAGSGVYMSTLDSGLLNVALPTLQREFGAPVTSVQWVVLAYVLCITGLLLPMGRLADIVGRKRVFLAGLIIFTVASALCGLAPSLDWLVAARVLAGIGGAMTQANSAGLIAQAFPAEQRGRALGLNGAIVSAGLLSGPVIGGLIIQAIGWNWIFFLNVPLGIAATIFGARLLRETGIQPGQRFDLAGAALFMALVVGLLLTLNWGGQQGLTPTVLGLALLTLAVGVVFAVVEARAPQPMLEFRLFANPGFRAASIAAFLSFLGISHTQLLLPFYLQDVLGLLPSQVGLVLVTIPSSLLVLGPLAGALSDRIGSRVLASVGLVVTATGLLSLATLGAETPVALVVARLMLVAVGMGCFGTPNSSALFGSLPRERYGVGGAYQSLTRNLGQSIGQTMAAALWSAVVVSSSGGLSTAEAPVPALLDGFAVAFTVAAGIVLCGAVVSYFARPTRPAPAPAPVAEAAGRRS